MAPTPSTPAAAGIVRVGVAGWSYPDWEGIVYPTDKPPRFDRLAFLARYFDAIEVNSTFYRPAPAGMTASWVRRVGANETFRFTVKLWKVFTHERTGGDTEERLVREGLEPLVAAGRLGAVLVQFPWSFKNEPEARRYLAALLERFADYPRVVEVRHASWDDPEVYAFLERAGAGFCNVDQPVIGRSLRPSDRATGPVGYVRLHGRNYRDWFREDAGRDARYDYLYSPEELDPWVEGIRRIARRARETYAIANNHFRGQAAVNALELRARLEGRKVPAPPSLVEHYPVLAAFAEPSAGAAPPPRTQGRLF